MYKRVALVSLAGMEELTNQKNKFTVFNNSEPLGLLYLASVAKKSGCEVEIFHHLQSKNSTERDMEKNIAEFRPDIVGFSTMTNAFPRSVAMAQRLKDRLPDILIIFGGDHIGIVPQDLKENPVIDLGILGEGESSFKKILDGENFQDIDGMAFLSNGSFVVNAQIDRIRDRSVLPHPYRDGEIIKKSKVGALMYPSIAKQTGTASFMFRFGCPFGCAYCSATTLYGSQITGCSVDYLIEEMKQVKKDHNINTAFFVDLTFNLILDKSIELCRKIEQEKLGIYWYALIRVPSHNAEQQYPLLEAMASANCSKIGLGLESWNEQAMNDYGRKIELNETAKILRKIDDLGMISKIFIIIGHPDEDIDYYDEVIEKVKWLRPDEVRISFLTPFPNTDLWNKLENDDFLTKDYNLYTTFNPILKMKNMAPMELINQRMRILNEYYASDEFRSHMAEKIERFPHLVESFDEFIGLLKDQKIILD